MWCTRTTPGNGPLPSGRATYAWIWSPFAPAILTTDAVIPSGSPVLKEFHEDMNEPPRRQARGTPPDLPRERAARSEPLPSRFVAKAAKLEVVGGWEKLPQAYAHRDVAAVAVDKNDRVYLATRVRSCIF